MYMYVYFNNIINIYMCVYVYIYIMLFIYIYIIYIGYERSISRERRFASPSKIYLKNNKKIHILNNKQSLFGILSLSLSLFLSLT